MRFHVERSCIFCEINDFSWFFPFFGGCMAAKPPIPMSPDPPRVKPQLLSFSRKKTANYYLLSVSNSRNYTHSIRNWWQGKKSPKKYSTFSIASFTHVCSLFFSLLRLKADVCARSLGSDRSFCWVGWLLRPRLSATGRSPISLRLTQCRPPSPYHPRAQAGIDKEN